MKQINNKGFTLVELIATIVILSIVMTIGAISITSIVKRSKEKEYELLIKEIKNAVELYYQECHFHKTDAIACPTLTNADGYYLIPLQYLINYGFIKGNQEEGDDDLTIVNPKNNFDSGNCWIYYKYQDGQIMVKPRDGSDTRCPTGY